MSELGKDNFEEFLKNSLEDYSSSDSPNWDEMESRLDEAQSGASSGSGILKTPLAKWVAAIVVIGGLTVLVANLLNNDGVNNPDQDETEQDSFINRMRALNIADDSNNDGLASDQAGSKEQVSEDVVYQEGNNKNAGGIQKSDSQGQEAQTSDAEPTVFIKAVMPVSPEKSGPVLDMLRTTTFKDQSAPDPVAEFNAGIKEGCVPLTVNFKLESQDVAMKYLWNFGDGVYSTDANPAHVFRETGTYTVALTVTSLINQKYITEVTEEPVIVYGKPDVDFKIGADYNEAGNEIAFVNYSGNIVDWSWSFGDGSTSNEENPKHTYRAEDSYEVVLIGKDANGCRDTASSIIRISGKQLTNKFFAPTAFTPNGDGSNDEFRAIINGAQTLEFEMLILNRQGSVIFETDDINQAWDGRLKGSGKIAAQGPYIWQITFKDNRGNNDRQTGIVSLLK